MKKIITIIAVCAAIGAAVGAVVCFHEEIRAFVKSILDKCSCTCCTCCDDFDDIDDFDDFEDVYTF